MNFQLVLELVLTLFLVVLATLIVLLKKRLSYQEITFLSVIQIVINSSSFAVPFLIFFVPDTHNVLWDVSLYSVFFLMCIRPLRDLFPQASFAKLMPLRKNLGIFSALIVVVFGIVHYLNVGPSALLQFFTLSHWTFEHNIFWGHMGELTGVILLVTSNKISMKLLRRNWKRIQRLSYLYFFSGAWYVFASFGKLFGVIAIIIVFQLTLFAFLKKRMIKYPFYFLDDLPEKVLASFCIFIILIGSVTGAVTVIHARETSHQAEQSITESVAVIQQYEQEVRILASENQVLANDLEQVKKNVATWQKRRLANA